MEILQSVVMFVIGIMGFGYAFFAWRSWEKDYEIEAIWRILNAVFWLVVYYGRTPWH